MAGDSEAQSRIRTGDYRGHVMCRGNSVSFLSTKRSQDQNHHTDSLTYIQSVRGLQGTQANNRIRIIDITNDALWVRLNPESVDRWPQLASPYIRVTRVVGEWSGGVLSVVYSVNLSAFALYLSTYITVVISLDRCVAILDPMRRNGAAQRVKIMVCFAWILSALFSIPQVS
ncbi:hypothetical protein RRG08_051336 [Elysia crispata]|uniref:G-protein coupled receptors family 1 profile domain-containing protein n=1 Tax=Elysia crispata TaxID=231223 RepID=A0AAE1B3X3_9GAST|nr:hypothetical protein RRG08_051336 [Elysia crispata]